MGDELNIYPWQHSLWQDFQQAKTLGRLPHAVLIHGAIGLGKKHFAYCMAQNLLCEQQTATACTQCRSCHWVQQAQHGDLYELAPAEAGKAIKIDAVRHSLTWLSLSPQQGKAKVLIIAPAESLNIAASNALLKNLEEPTANTFIILITSHLAGILATIRSRCQLWAMPLATLLQSQDFLKAQGIQQNITLTEHTVGPLALLSQIENGSLLHQAEMAQAIAQFNSQQILALDFSQSLQKYPVSQALAALYQDAQFQLQQALQQQAIDLAQRYVKRIDLLMPLIQLQQQNANVNWPLQFDALCYEWQEV